MSDFAHLHVHTEYSALDGAARVKPLAARAAELGMRAVGMTDHGNMFGAYEFQQEVKKAGVKPVIGVEAYIAPASRLHKKPVFWDGGGKRSDDEGRDVGGGGAHLHMTMLAETAEGLRNLFWLTSQASLTGFYRKPRMDKDLIAERSGGIIATTGCLGGEVGTRLRLGQFDEAVKAAGEWQDIFGKDNYFLEVMDHGIPLEQMLREDLLKLGKLVGIRPLATNDSHYVLPDEADAHDTLLCVGVGKTKDDPMRFRFAGEGYYLKSPAEMRELWDREIPDACDNTLLIAERVQPYDEVFAHRDLMPRFGVPEGHTQESWLRDEVERGLQVRYGDDTTTVARERIEYELSVIGKMGFAAYFLVVADIVRYARESGVACGPGRGSTAGSLVAYVLRITELDPLVHGLMFERFLNPDRVSPPDADLDFDDRRRADVIRYVTEKYGAAHCGQIITFSGIRAKAALKDACRVLDLPYALGEKLTKAFPQSAQGAEITLADILDKDSPRYGETATLRQMYETDPDVKKIIDAARGIEGIARGTGVHAAGFIISAEPLIDVLPIFRRESDGATIAGFAYPQAESMGLLKVDFLGLRNLTIMLDAVEGIKRRLGVDIDLHALTLDDVETYKLLARGDTLGVFQLDGAAMRDLLRLMRPTGFGDISAALALYRPGPMGADAHTNYALRKNGKQENIPIHPELTEPLGEILGETYGLIVYQEQVMAAAQILAGFTLASADMLRRAMGKKKKSELDKQYDAFEAGMKANGYSAGAVKAIWDILLPFSDYAFNKAHSAGYGLVSYWTAYLKAHYPADYMAAVLTSVGDNKDRTAIYLAECRHMGVKVLPPDVNTSTMNFTAVSDTEVRFGLKAVRNVGEGAVEAIVAGRRSGIYDDFGDYLARVLPAGCNRRTVESLVKAGAFDTLGHPRKGLWMVHEAAVEAASAVNKRTAVGQDSLFGDDLERVDVPGMEWDKKTLLDFEREMLGLYVSDHPLNGAEETLQRHRTATIAEVLEEAREDAQVTICGMAVRVEHRTSKGGNGWCRAVLEDLDATVEVVVFGKPYELLKTELIEDAVLAVDGKVQLRDGGISIVASSVRQVEVVLGDQPIVIKVREQDLTAKKVQELREMLAEHKGDIPVQLAIRKGIRTVMMALPEHPVTRSAAFAADVKSLLGASAMER